jgi:type II secretory pathway pseudopilin PulG
MSVNPYESPDTVSKAPEPKSVVRFRLIELLVILGVIGILIGLMLPAVRTAREPARRTQCSNNLKQIALGLLNYSDQYGTLPPAYTVDAQGKPLHSWRTLILPYLEQQALYDKIDFSKPWDDPANKAAFDAVISVYGCPSATCPAGQTTYLAVVAPGGCFRPAGPRKLREVTDGTDSTLMVIEVDSAHAVHWMSPQDANEELILSLVGAKHPAHSGGAQAALVSGRIIFLPVVSTEKNLRALISIAGNDEALAN